MLCSPACLPACLTDCAASEFVIKRDGSNVDTNSACVAQSGHWVSPYDGDGFDEASELDIDHTVPLKNAWIVSLLYASPRLAWPCLVSPCRPCRL